MNFFNSSFYQNSLALNQSLKYKNIQETTFPELECTYDNDKFWKHLWKSIDEAKVSLRIKLFSFPSIMFGWSLLSMIIQQQHLTPCKN